MTKRHIIKNLIFLLEIILMFVFQQVPLFSLQIIGVQSLLVVPAFVSMGVFMDEKECMTYGVLSGLLLDMQISNIFGIHTLLFFLLGYGIGFLSEHVIKTNMINTVIISFIVTCLVVGIRFLFFYVLKGYGDVNYAFINHYLPIIFYTVVITPVVYLFNRAISYFAYGRGGV